MCLGFVLDYILEIFEASPFDIGLPTPDQVMEMAENQDDGKEYIGYLWNDESHSFQEVIDQLVDGIGCTEAQGKKIADDVDEKVRFLR
jgi:E3 ubiquitin-protein ligase UBR1